MLYRSNCWPEKWGESREMGFPEENKYRWCVLKNDLSAFKRKHSKSVTGTPQKRKNKEKSSGSGEPLDLFLSVPYLLFFSFLFSRYGRAFMKRSRSSPERLMVYAGAFFFSFYIPWKNEVVRWERANLYLGREKEGSNTLAAVAQERCEGTVKWIDDSYFRTTFVARRPLSEDCKCHWGAILTRLHSRGNGILCPAYCSPTWAELNQAAFIR